MKCIKNEPEDLFFTKKIFRLIPASWQGQVESNHR